jgi:hypothetical protein
MKLFKQAFIYQLKYPALITAKTFLLYQPVWTILVKLGELNMTPLIILNKTQSFITG